MKKIETTRQLQLVALYIYKDLLNFCEEHGLRLYLLGGSLIGALRNKGFIPWDDDIDVCMSRDDYEKLIQLSGCRISPKCSIIDPAAAEWFRGYIPLAVYNESRLHSGQYKENEQLKVSVSIFVYDGAPEGWLSRRLYYTRMYFLRAEHALCRADFRNVSSKLARVIGPLLSLMYKPDNVYDYKKKILLHTMKHAYGKSRFVAPNADTNAWLEVFSRESFETPVELDFEGVRSYAFQHYHEHLTHYYGDYMQPPPENQQVPKHSFEAWIEDDFIFEEHE